MGRVLSVYLDVDQSNAENLNRNFEAVFESKIKEAERLEEEYERRDFDGCVAEVRKVLAAYQPRARGLVIFARSTGLIWLREFNVPVVTVIWGATAHVQQFVEALDEFETYGVVLSDRSTAGSLPSSSARSKSMAKSTPCGRPSRQDRRHGSLVFPVTSAAKSRRAHCRI